ncbi:DegT/DnrJ/EryC1/StrS family aminotransferase [Salipaludibacillus sp. LMS25]|uniref:DegT/DnrJ/EryC1/StrS aminotransferase family protein n=1 Tax=Salipaludibacillus sp. LMS25 TaxID=2924031 RepID=UPI0020D10525|nr:DegT/DnrJ/EryC1/StrS family aminotransferase [Salipaludibacillus sp. LMS25]UTR16512.1 DegT/DnrJ/EryC1/StrS family aminotransferase [Salipaludibacillus sp. LMS25]
MRTDFIKKPLDFPSDDMIHENLAYFGGKAILPADNRKTNFPYITKEDMMQILISIQHDPTKVIDDFTNRYRNYVGSNYAIPTASGTSSLHLALVGAGVQPGDEVLIPNFTFIATAQAVVAAKAIPVFTDIDPDTYCMDVTQVEKLITPKTKVIMPVHVHGLPADLPQLQKICHNYQLKLVEDASHAHSASINNKICGSIGDAAGQSLMADKNFPVGGEGGMAFFKKEEDYMRALEFLSDSGIDYSMSWIAAAFGISQLERLPYYDKIRARNAKFLSDALENTDLFSPPYVPEGYKHSYNMYRIKINPGAKGLDDLEDYKVKEAIQQIIMEEGVFAREWQNRPIPGHLPFQNKKGFGNQYPFCLSNVKRTYKVSDYPKTLNMFRNTLTICRELRSPIEYERIQSYALAFKKIDQNPDKIRRVVEELGDIKRPYEKDARLG